MYIVCGYFVSAEMCLMLTFIYSNWVMLTFIYSNVDAITDENIRLQKIPDEQGVLMCLMLTFVYSNADAITDENIQLQKIPDAEFSSVAFIPSVQLMAFSGAYASLSTSRKCK